MCLKFAPLVLLCLSGLAAQKIQVGVDQSVPDHQPSESGFVGFAQPAASQAAGSKYFQYIHVPAKDHYEHGHKRGNEHHFIERHEKGQPHLGEFKNKVRWGDKHGGYGEHYWDYNHAGHDGHDGEESQHSENYEEYPEETKDSPSIYRGKRNPDEEVEFINDKARSLILNARAPKHGGNYRRAKNQRSKRQPDVSSLVFDQKSGLIVDESTGIQYQLQEVNNNNN